MTSKVALGPMGMATALGIGLKETLAALKAGRRHLAPLGLFPIAGADRLPVGAVDLPLSVKEEGLPRTHQLARLAADEVFANRDRKPDAVVVGTTTGGIDRSESLLLEGEKNPSAYQRHGANSVAMDLARRYGCTGPVLTISAACASGAIAIALGAEMIRRGYARSVLAGGVDGLCRLTYFGFKSLQLIDPQGARPLDLHRRGMNVAEGAGFVLLCSDPIDADGIALWGSGLSCDAHHAVAPHPEGRGALAAMQGALEAARITVRDVDYINLHGTATPDNDRSEARALNTLFSGRPPHHSSIKGAMGHSLAASGAVEGIVAALCLKNDLIPANVGLGEVDPKLNLAPVRHPMKKRLKTILSNSFGFGGNNVALVFGRSSQLIGAAEGASNPARFSVIDYACVTAAGFLEETLAALAEGKPVSGCIDSRTLCRDLQPALIRRAKRLPRLALALASRICTGKNKRPHQISLGTGWGGLSETHEFLTRLFESDLQFPSPTDFIGSVHNAAAGQIAQMHNIQGANITVSGGDASFEQALLSTDLISDNGEKITLVLGVDEAHSHLSPLFDPSMEWANDGSAKLTDGGGALLLARKAEQTGVSIDLAFYGQCHGSSDADGIVDRLIARLRGVDTIRRSFGTVLVGMPLGADALAEKQLKAFQGRCGRDMCCLEYRRLVGQFAGAASIAAVLGVHWVRTQAVLAKRWREKELPLDGKGILILNLGDAISAMRILP